MAIYYHSGSDVISFIDAMAFSKRQSYLPFILGSYVIGHLLSFISSIIIEKFSVWTIGYPSKYLLGFSPKGYFSINKFIRVLVGILLLPISVTEVFFKCTLNYRATYTKPLDNFLIASIKVKMDSLIRDKSGLTDYPPNTHSRTSDFFRFAYHYALENSPNHLPKIQNYVALFGFLRTMTLIAVLVFWSFVWHIFQSSMNACYIFTILVMLSLLNFTFYMAFVKFWRRFTLEVLMSIATSYEVTEKKDPVDFLRNN